MFEIKVANVNQAVSEAIHWLSVSGEREESRNGPVLVSPTPVVTTYTAPLQRVLFSPLRNANPFFHLMESLWMLAGRNDLEWPAYFNKGFAAFSDNGQTLHGAYGYRWRRWFGFDQLTMLAVELHRNPTSRRAVLTMWDAALGRLGGDLRVAIGGGKDVPCNTHVYFDCRGGRLNMTVCCRSNDIFWGAYGANAVHFSFLLEYLAAAIGIAPGEYRQFSNNFHAYTDVFPESSFADIARDAYDHDYYSLRDIPHFPLVQTNTMVWNEDLKLFFKEPLRVVGYRDPFFSEVAAPIYRAWRDRKDRFGDGSSWMKEIGALDWRLACTEWIERSNERAAAKMGGA